jgi:hypothetical protein
MTRWHQNDAITTDTFFLPFVEPLLVALAAARPLEVIIEVRLYPYPCRFGNDMGYFSCADCKEIHHKLI